MDKNPKKSSIDGSIKMPDSQLTEFLAQAEITIKDVFNHKKGKKRNNGQKK